MFQVPPLYLIFCSNEDYEEISKHREEALRREALAEEALRSGTLFGNDNTTGRVGPAYQPQVHLKPMCQADSGRAASSQLCRCCKGICQGICLGTGKLLLRAPSVLTAHHMPVYLSWQFMNAFASAV